MSRPFQTAIDNKDGEGKRSFAGLSDCDAVKQPPSATDIWTSECISFEHSGSRFFRVTDIPPSLTPYPDYLPALSGLKTALERWILDKTVYRPVLFGWTNSVYHAHPYFKTQIDKDDSELAMEFKRILARIAFNEDQRADLFRNVAVHVFDADVAWHRIIKFCPGGLRARSHPSQCDLVCRPYFSDR